MGRRAGARMTIANDPATAEDLLAAGEFARAADVAAACLFEDPRNARLLCVMALAERGQGRGVDAMRNVTDALRHDPLSAWAHSIRALLNLESSCLIEAERDASRAAQLDPSWAEPRMLRARALAHMRRYGDARIAVHQALAVDPQVAGGRELLESVEAVELETHRAYRAFVDAAEKVAVEAMVPARLPARRRHAAVVASGLISLLAVLAQAVMLKGGNESPTASMVLILSVVVALRQATAIFYRS
jgi:tetratricopeptide (TPR) repeat protein